MSNTAGVASFTTTIEISGVVKRSPGLNFAFFVVIISSGTLSTLDRTLLICPKTGAAKTIRKTAKSNKKRPNTLDLELLTLCDMADLRAEKLWAIEILVALFGFWIKMGTKGILLYMIDP
jgi:hypothetical protein